MKYKAAIIGVGKAGGGGAKGGGHAIGYTHAAMYRSAPARVQLVASADINPQNLEAFRIAFDVASPFADYRQMLREARPDIVSIATYVGLHAEIIEACAAAGVRAIFCEKPFLASIPQCRRVEQIARETGVKIAVAHVRRYRPAFRRARELFNDGTIGRPILCAAGIEGWDLSEWGSHWLDMFRFLNDDRAVRWVFGQARVRDFRGYGHAMEEHAVACFEFDNGCRGLLDGGKALACGGDVMLLGSDGTIRVADETTLTITGKTGQAVESHGAGASGGWEACWPAALSDLLGWLDGSAEPTIGLSSMLRTSELNLAAYLSVLRGDRVDLPVSDDADEWPVEALQRRSLPSGPA